MDKTQNRIDKQRSLQRTARTSRRRESFFEVTRSRLGQTESKMRPHAIAVSDYL